MEKLGGKKEKGTFKLGGRGRLEMWSSWQMACPAGEKSGV